MQKHKNRQQQQQEKKYKRQAAPKYDARRSDVNVDGPAKLRIQSDAIEVAVDDGDVATHNGKNNIQESTRANTTTTAMTTRQKIKMGEKSFIHKVVAKRSDSRRRRHAKLQEHVQKQRRRLLR